MLSLPSLVGEPAPPDYSGQAFVGGLQHRPGIQPLNTQQIRYEIDMCVGCDRCMLACPVPLSAIVTIADLNHATISGTLTGQVARFTDECVMCGSCVPVCPVDNHRDLLMLSLKQRLGVAWDKPVDPRRVQQNLPAGWNVSLLLSRLREQAIFRESQLIPDQHLLHIVMESNLLVIDAGEMMLREGEFGRDLYFILDGRFELASAGPRGSALPVAMSGRGEYMGDYAMLTGQPQPFSTRAVTPALILLVPEQVMQRLMELQPAVRGYFEQVSSARSLTSTMKRLALFQGIADADIGWIVQQSQIRRYEREEQLFSEDGQGQPAREVLHVVLEGFVKVARRTVRGAVNYNNEERIIAYRQRGDYFAGGLDMQGDRRAVSVTAITRVGVAEVPRQAMIALFHRYPDVAQRFQAQLQLYQAAAQAAHTGLFEAVSPDRLQTTNVNGLSNAEARLSLHALVEDGVIEGTEVLVIDLSKCIHCSECEEACARRHGHSRMHRKGIVVGNLSIASACRHCQDPVCMLCSRAGIARMPGGEVYITENCIGCGICAERCPYDNISIVTLEEIRQDTETHSTWEQFSKFFKKGIGKEYGRYASDKLLPMATNTANARPLNAQQPVDAFGEMLKKVAVKCDLCAGYENQACVQACPTGAAFRTQPVSFFGTSEEILQRRAR
ncbi:MAG TPA: cyclic nucleotide-binding domain-containing protein [Ktedonobacteraceae bacterium]|nr:cyclic nucleotide-binding domain-containing protein [Ktedonobacteraceae bacterium]